MADDLAISGHPVPRIDVHPSPERYAAACRSVIEGSRAPEGPVPALAGPRIDRYLRLAGDAHLAWAAIDPASVVAVRRGDRYEPFARLLAALTGRRLHELDPGAAPEPIDGTPITFVIEPAAATTDVLAWAAGPHPVGILTARSDEAMAALVVRTAVRPRRSDGSGWLDLDSLTWPDQRLYADGRSVTDRSGSLALLTARGHSRGCCLHLPDGLLCGRDPDLSDDERISPSLGGQLSSCAQGEGCFRFAIGRGQRQPVRDVAADVLLLDGCHALQVAEGQSPAEISMALAALDGTAVAVVASPWLRVGARIPGPVLAALLASGHGLGRALAILNECILAEPAGVGLFAMLGDAGLVPEPGGRVLVHDLERLPDSITCGSGCALVRLRLAERLAAASDRLSITASAPVHAVRRGEKEVLVLGDRERTLEGKLRVDLLAEAPGALVRGRSRNALARLRAADSLGLRLGPRVDALDRVVRELASAWFRPLPDRDEELCLRLVARVESSIDSAQRAVVEQCLEQHASGFDTIPDTWRGPFEFRAEDVARCPTCGRAGTRYSVTHVVVAGSRFFLQSCAYCSVVCGGHVDADFTMTVRGADHVLRGDNFHYDVEIGCAASEPLRGVVGACISGEQQIDARFRQVHDVHADQYGPWRQRLTGSFPSPRSSADRSFAVVVACVNGSVHIAYRNLWLRTGPAGRMGQPSTF